MAGDSGAGYLNPGDLTPPRRFSGLPSGLAAWEKHCAPFYQQWDITLTGFIIDGDGPQLTAAGLDAYARFSPDGIVAYQKNYAGVHHGMPYLPMRADLVGSPAEAARAVREQTRDPAHHFYVFRSILKTPAWHLAVAQALQQSAGDEIKMVDLYSLLGLVREYETDTNAAAGWNH